MALTNTIPLGAAVQAPPIVAELQRLFANLDDAPLIQALVGPTRRGPKGHSVQALWRCFVAKYTLDLPSTAALIRTLVNNPWVAQACGIPWPDGIPHEATFSRFFTRLSQYDMAARVKDVSRRLVRKQYATVPGFGQRVALDSTTLKAWSNGSKAKHADSQAGWSIKTGTQGRKEFTYGWKLHLLVDAESELPIAANVSAGNVHDSKRASNVLQEARHITGKFHPKYVIADKGYSGQPLRHLIKRQYRAEPIIQVNKTHKKLMATLGESQNTAEWKAIYKQRQAVERVFSRLKGQHSLNSIRVRHLNKVTIHAYLSLIAAQAKGIGDLRAGLKPIGQLALPLVL